MKIDPNAPAYPVDVPPSREQIAGAGWIDVPGFRSPGISIRAAMATQIMAGIVAAIHNNERMAATIDKVSKSDHGGSIESCVSTMAVNYANGLIDALNRGNP